MAYVVRGVGGRGFVLVNKGSRYQRNWSSKAVVSWRCFREDCGAFLKTDMFDLEDPNDHIRILKVSTSAIFNQLNIK